MRRNHSLLLKLFLLFLATAATLTVTVGAYMALVVGPRADSPSVMQRNLELYGDTMIGRLGAPPDPLRAEALGNELGIRVRVKDARGEWATHPDTPTFDEAERKSWSHGDSAHGPAHGRYRHHWFLVLERSGVRYLFALPHERWFHPNRIEIAGLIALVLFVLALSHLAFRWVFRPLRWMMAGVREVSEGNLEVRVPEHRRDELGEVARAFNSMTGRVREMIRSKEQLLLDVSHELRSPLTRMKVALQFVQDPKLRESLDQDLGEMESMLGEMLDSERLASAHGGLSRVTTDLVAVLKRLEAKFRSQGPGVRFQSEVDSLELDLDPRWMERALANVIENALKYSAGQSTPVELSLSAPEGQTLIRVRDHGPGIPPGEQERIFEPFYRVDRARTRETGGYGLGLSLARKIVRAHGGEIALTSAPGAGATFEIRIASFTTRSS